MVLIKSGALSDPVPFDTMVQHSLLATDCDRIAVGLVFEFPSMCKIKLALRETLLPTSKYGSALHTNATIARDEMALKLQPHTYG